MPAQCVIAPSPAADWERALPLVGLARTVSGTLFRKHILSRGKFRHPNTGEDITVDDSFVNSLKQNFTSGVCPIVQVPLANDKNEHVECPEANLGEVVGVEDDPTTGKIYALVDARKDAENFGKTYLGASAFMHLDYEDTKTGGRVGPTLLHVAVTNRPYMTDLDPYEAVAAAAERFSDPAIMEMVVAASSAQEGVVPRTLEEILAELKTEHEIDVLALQATAGSVEGLRTELETAQDRASAAEDEQALAAQIAATLRGSGSEVKLTSETPNDTGVSNADLVSAVAELAQHNVVLSNSRDEATARIVALERRNVEREIDGYVSEGRILPAKREVYLTMAMDHRELFEQVLPAEPLVALNAESGQAPRGDEHQAREVDVEAEVTRLAAQLSAS